MKPMNWIRVLAAFVPVALWTATPVPAQVEEDRPRDPDEVVIEVDDEGRLVVDGEPVSDENGRVVVRIEPDGVEIDGTVSGRRHVRFHRSPDGTRTDRFVWSEEGIEPFVRRSIDRFDVRPFVARFDPPDFEPMLERFRMEWEGDLEGRVEEYREVAELERESRELAGNVRRAEGEEREALETELREKLAEIFDRKMELRRERIERLEEQLEERQSAYEERTSERDAIIERRLEELLGTTDVLEW